MLQSFHRVECSLLTWLPLQSLIILHLFFQFSDLLLPLCDLLLLLSYHFSHVLDNCIVAFALFLDLSFEFFSVYSD